MFMVYLMYYSGVACGGGCCGNSCNDGGITFSVVVFRKVPAALRHSACPCLSD